MEREQDKTIRELFQQLKRSDERDVPSFDGTLNRVPEDFIEARARSLRWLPVATIVAVVLFAGFGLYYEVSWKGQQTSIGTSPTPQTAKTLPLPTTVVPPTVEVVEAKAKPRPYRVRPRPLARAAAIVKWRSPTAFLLPAPDDRFLKDFPRLDESLIKIRPLLPGLAN